MQRGELRVMKMMWVLALWLGADTIAMLGIFALLNMPSSVAVVLAVICVLIFVNLNVVGIKTYLKTRKACLQKETEE